MEVQFLIRNGMIVDGTGAPAYRGDVRVRHGRIAQIAPSLETDGRERVVDASGCYVTPGFIEQHNHWDAGVWWAPMLEPLSGYGVTTSINGNCGFSLAPAHPDPAVREEMIDIFNYFEDIPAEPQRDVLAWDWRTWSEYRTSMERRVTPALNFGVFCGHIALRLAVLGLDAWNRAATAAEAAEMAALLDDALAAGAMGLSTNFFDYDRRERPLPSQLADDAELRALLEVLGRYPGATFEVITDIFMRNTAAATVERLGAIAAETNVRMQWVGVPAFKYQAPIRPELDALHERFKAEGRDFWTGFHHVSPTSMMNFVSSLVFSQNGNPVWQELVNAQGEEAKLKLLDDPDWRDRARESWNNQLPHSYLNDPSALIFRESETGYTPTGITLADYMASTGIAHPSDALAQYLLTNGVGSLILKRSLEVDEEVVLRLLKDPRSVGNISDAGAHGKLFCGAGDNVLLLTDYVRDRGVLTIEEAIHVLTGKVANFLGLRERGELKVGNHADLTVFDLSEIERRPEEKVWDVPDGKGGRTYRYTRAAAPTRLTLVNGVPTFDHGAPTGRFPGQFIAPGAAVE
ncbi:amidohydrolase family protein [Frankia sp. R82]|uniref:N-acyl-D-amino-acid deacylase family protein n=1 Tax=Frankia sp. R82 TaxID=2950553 RepID=UPI00204367F7|nr:amidohydrolase family protein [Frankia sp. R82]MCM3886084.1 amidohydrolase family protein [Frankia sp. R82]